MRHRIVLVLFAAVALSLIPGTASAAQPVITGISPANGSVSGGTQVTITGSAFASGASVIFGGAYASNVIVSSANVLVATAPPGAAGSVNVVVVNPDGSAGTSPVQFQYQTIVQGAVTIAGLNAIPGSGGTNTVYISGSGFVSGATVTIGGVSVGAGAVAGPSLIIAVAPAGVSTATATVTNPDGSFASYPAGSATPTSTTQPVVASVQPPSGSPAGGTAVSITGSGFLPGATVSFGGVPATSVTVVSATLITAVTPANAAGSVTVLVSNSTGSVGGLNSAFTYAMTAPVLSTITPNSGPVAGGTAVTLTGSGFVTGATVTFGGLAAGNVIVAGGTQILATTPPGTVGPSTVLVTNPGGLISGIAGGFNYLAAGTTPPASATGIGVTSVSPASGPVGTPTLVTINGHGFVAGAIVTIGGVPATNVNVISSTQILASVPTSPAAGPALVVVSNAGGAGAALPGGYTYTSGTAPAPTGSTTTFPPGSSGLFVFGGGSNQALVTATGCPAGRLVLWATNPQGQWVGYIPGAPAVINLTWDALFPNGIPAGTAVYVKCSA